MSTEFARKDIIIQKLLMKSKQYFRDSNFSATSTVIAVTSRRNCLSGYTH